MKKPTMPNNRRRSTASTASTESFDLGPYLSNLAHEYLRLLDAVRPVENDENMIVGRLRTLELIDRPFMLFDPSRPEGSNTDNNSSAGNDRNPGPPK